MLQFRVLVNAREYFSQTKRRTSSQLKARTAVSYSTRNVDCSFGRQEPSARHRSRSCLRQRPRRLARSIGAVRESVFACCSCSLKVLGSVRSTALIESSCGEPVMLVSFFLENSGICSDLSARLLVRMGANMLELASVLGVSHSDGAGVVQ